MRQSLVHQGIQLETLEMIGKGSFAVVCRGFSNNLACTVAIKIIDIRVKTEFVDRFLPREMDIIIRSDKYVAIIQEYASNGDLLRLIMKVQRIEEHQARFYFIQLIEAIKYLWANNIVHRDIKCENIFLDAYMNVKLGDFGFARVLQEDEDTNTHCGSKAYTALELLQGKRYKGNGADIWSAGVVLYIMLTGRMMFDERHPEKMIERQERHAISFPTSVPESARSLIRHMVHPKRECRATISDVLNHNWLRGTRKQDHHFSSQSTNNSRQLRSKHLLYRAKTQATSLEVTQSNSSKPPNAQVSPIGPVVSTAVPVVAPVDPVGPDPVPMQCPNCKAKILTQVDLHAGVFAWVLAGLLCPVLCCCLPFLCDNCQDTHHLCPSCGAHLGKFRTCYD
ncbi:protein kinase domain-containing protein [Ditylenchus destructor]|uniref:Protein kinase domain-containing protein n=1 Tax=Ditylenchus destructor TaxID=166010 RepID=A0AAD4N8C5_9BILA|nr:protein kinase domain-containing protein [Ditylenchus destructor]